MSNRAVALMREHREIELDDIHLDTGHGVLPAYCKCKGFLDFVRSSKDNNKTALKCRECGIEVELD